MKKNEKGFSLIEVVIALLLLGIIGVALLSGLATASMALVIADERATAESLARSQMEYVKNQAYITAAPYDSGVPGSGEVTYDKITGIPDSYTIWSEDRTGQYIHLEDEVIGVPWDSQNNLPVDSDVGLQRIELVIKHNGREIITLEDYKVDR